MQNTKKLFLLFILLTFFNVQLYPQAKSGIGKVVIDAGHGGTDPGAVGSKGQEKDVTLAVALQVGKLISENCPGVEVYYTRKTDVFIPLYNRSKIANDKHADLFISIHCNAAENKTARGTETFVMGLHKTASNLEVARKENAAMLLEKDYKSNYGDFNPNSPESYVIFSLYTNVYLHNSALLASKVQRNLLKCNHFTDRGVQQAGFWVLHKVAMPSILIELGFISNKEEEAILLNKESQKAMATSICNAFIEYKNQMEGTSISKLPEKTVVKPVEEKPEKKDTVATTASPTSTTSSEPATTTQNATSDVVFKVQLYASPVELPVTHEKFKGVDNVEKYCENQTWKYTVGNEPTFEKAQEIQKVMKAKFPDAFIIAFKNGEKIPVSEARKLVH